MRVGVLVRVVVRLHLSKLIHRKKGQQQQATRRQNDESPEQHADQKRHDFLADCTMHASSEEYRTYLRKRS